MPDHEQAQIGNVVEGLHKAEHRWIKAVLEAKVVK